MIGERVSPRLRTKIRSDTGRGRYHATGMDDDIPVVVRMRVECAKCGHLEDETYERKHSHS